MRVSIALLIAAFVAPVLAAPVLESVRYLS